MIDLLLFIITRLFIYSPGAPASPDSCALAGRPAMTTGPRDSGIGDRIICRHRPSVEYTPCGIEGS